MQAGQPAWSIRILIRDSHLFLDTIRARVYHSFMPRTARIVLPGLPHHVIQRGNNRQDVFFVDDDRRAYLEFLAAEAERHRLAILAYCLMTNHVHLVVVPHGERSLAAAVGRTHWLYSQYVNRLHNRTGHLWQNRFYSSPLEETHTQRACLYVERNPVRARMVRQPWRYAWSSAAAHVGDAPAAKWLDVDGWRSLCQTHRWRQQLLRLEDKDDVAPLRRALRTGRPLASDAMLAKFEKSLGRRLRPRPVGRPRKPATDRRNARRKSARKRAS